MNRRPIRHSVLLSWIAWSAGFLLVVLGLITVFLSVSSRLITDQVSAINMGLAAQMQHQFDAQLQEIVSIALQIHTDPDAAAMMVSDNTDPARDSGLFRHVVTLFRTLQTTHGYVQRMFLVMPGMGWILSDAGVEDWQTFPDRPALEGLLAAAADAGVHQMPAQARYAWLVADGGLTFFSEPPGSTATNRCYLLIRTSQEHQLRTLRRMREEYGGVQFITTGDRTMVLATHGSAVELLHEYRALTPPRPIATTLPQSTAVIARADSPDWPFRYYSVFPNELYLREAKHARRVSLVIMLILTASGGLLFAGFAARNYLPIRRVVRSLESAVGHAQEGGNEYQRLARYAHQLVRQNRMSAAELGRFEDDRRNQYLLRMIGGLVAPETVPGEILSPLLDSGCPAFALVFIEFGQQAGEPGALTLAVSQLDLGAAPGVCTLLECRTDARVTALLSCNHDADTDGQQALLAHARRRLSESMREPDNSPLVVVGPSFRRLSDVPSIGALCEKRIVEARFFGTGPVLAASSETAPAMFYVDRRQLDAVVEKIREADVEDARRAVETILDACPVADVGDPERMKCILFSVFTTVVQTFASSPAGVETTRPMYRGAVDAFFAASDVQEMTDALLNLVERSCTAIAERKRSHNALLYQQIQDLVNRSLDDPSLYIPTIAEAFSLHPKYLSHFFKEQRGVGLAEYIREQRILRSQWLLTRNLPIREVAKKVGYSSVTTFNRAFRQQTGMTPSAYKEQQRLAALSEAPQRRDAQQNDT